MSTDDEVFNIIHLLSRTLHGAMGITGEVRYIKGWIMSSISFGMMILAWQRGVIRLLGSINYYDTIVIYPSFERFIKKNPVVLHVRSS